MAENCLVRVPLRCFTRIENVGTLQAEEKLHFWPDRVQVRRLRLVSVLICLVLLWISRLCLTSRRSQPPLAASVPPSRFTSRIGGGSAFYVRRTRIYENIQTFSI